MSTANRFIALVLITSLATGCVTPEAAPMLTCGQPAQTHELKFKLKSNGCVKSVRKSNDTDGTEVTVCRGDTVEWKVGASTKPKSVAFDKGGGSPFEWSDSEFQGNKITGVVAAGAAAQSYGYTVRTKGPPGDCPLDPVLIVRY